MDANTISPADNAPIMSGKTPAKLVAYLRVSTKHQGSEGLGIDGQRAAVRRMEGTIVREFVEVESGTDSERPKLAQALRECRLRGATLVVAKLDRLTRNVRFMTTLLDSRVEFVAADNPHANKLTIHLLTAVAENEAEMISARTKVALAQAKARGVRLGGSYRFDAAQNAKGARISADNKKAAAKAFAVEIMQEIAELRREGAGTLAQVAAGLTARGVLTRGGSTVWAVSSVSDVLRRAAE